jgi:hypothetical protein
MNATTAKSTNRIGRPALVWAAIAGIWLAVAVVAHPAAAAGGWTGDSQLTATSNYQPRIQPTGGTSAISNWQNGSNVYGRRTADCSIT